MKSEADFTKWFCTWLERCNCEVTPIVASAMQKPGIPDRHVMHKSFPQGQVWLEFKYKNGKLREIQREWFRKAHEHGLHAFIVRWDRGLIFTELPGGAVLHELNPASFTADTHLGPLLRGMLIESILSHWDVE